MIPTSEKLGAPGALLAGCLRNLKQAGKMASSFTGDKYSHDHCVWSIANCQAGEAFIIGPQFVSETFHLPALLIFTTHITLMNFVSPLSDH